jgi:hypothetical protein
MILALRLFTGAALAAAILLPTAAWAEPYLAVRQGFKCLICHVNPTGGGMRTAYGDAFVLNQLAAERVETPGTPNVWSNAIDELLTFGADLRTDATYTHVPGNQDSSAFETEELRLYVAAKVIPDRLLLYVDERFAPGGGQNMEAYARLTLDEQGRYYVKAGQFYLPYGLRLEDDSAFVRDVPGLNMTTPDSGVELGYEQGPWSLQLAASNGAGGGAENDEGKQAALRAEFVHTALRVGTSYAYNQTPAGSRNVESVFAGLRTGPLAWLAEADYIADETFAGGGRRQWAGLLEGNWNFTQGHNAKATAEYFDPDAKLAEDQQARYSALWEWTPIQFLQLRTGARIYEGIPQSALQNRRLYFVQFHAFF